MSLSRRRFIKTTAIGLSAIPFAGNFAFELSANNNNLYTLSDQLARQWGKAPLDLQVTDKADIKNYGGIFCPADKTVHGRVGDTVYPFLSPCCAN